MDLRHSHMPTLVRDHNWFASMSITEGLLSLQVCMYAPPTDSRSEWMLAVDLRASLLEYCEASGWRVRPSKAQTLGTALPKGYLRPSGILSPSAAGFHEEA